MIELLIITICLFINAILSGSETAYIALNKPTLRALVKQGNKKAQLLLDLRENPERTFSVIQIGITFVGFLAAAVGGAWSEERIFPFLTKNLGLGEPLSDILAILFVVVPLTYASVVLGELVPKSLALRKSMSVAFLAAPWLNLISHLISPIVTIFEWSTKKIIGLFPKERLNPDEVEAHVATLEDVLSPLNKQYIMNMVKIEKTTAKEIYVAWDQVVFVNALDAIEEVEKILITSGHTRLPIIQDKKVIGILNSKEFFALQKTGTPEWLSLCRQTVSIQENTLILTALRLLQRQRAHMAIVYEGSRISGILTMESIFEEIIGDIYDEDDDGAIQKILSTSRYMYR